MPAESASRSWRRYLRFSVRGLIALVLVIGAGMGWLVRSARIQRDAVAAIERAGGHVAYELPLGNGQYIRAYAPFWPRLMVDALGIEYVGQIVRVRLPREASDEGMVHVARLSGPFELLLSATEVTDAGLVHLDGLKNLTNLYLANTHVTDAGLVHLKGQSNLRLLVLSSSTISDAGLVHLKGLASLSDVNLSSTQVTDAGLVHLTRLTNLSVLALRGTQVTDGGARQLQRALPSLKIIR